MTRTAAHIGAPPILPEEDTWQALVLACAVTVLESVRSRPGRIATFTEDQFDTWRASVRLHRDAWRQYEAHAIADMVKAAELTETQGRAVGWWVNTSVPGTPFLPLLSPAETADALLQELAPDLALEWVTELLDVIMLRDAQAQESA